MGKMDAFNPSESTADQVTTAAIPRSKLHRVRFTPDAPLEPGDLRAIQLTLTDLDWRSAFNWDGSPYEPVCWADVEKDLAEFSRKYPTISFHLDVSWVVDGIFGCLPARSFRDGYVQDDSTLWHPDSLVRLPRPEDQTGLLQIEYFLLPGVIPKPA